MIPLPDADLIDQFRDAIALRFGLSFDEGKRAFLGEVLAKQLGQVKSADARTYIHALLCSQLTGAALAALVEELTVGETYFFRHSDQFRAFTNVVLAERYANRCTSRRLRILSAGCASGEEAYSLAILICEHIPDIANWDVRIVGIDLNPASLVKAKRAHYTSWSLRGVPDATRERSFQRIEKGYLLNEPVREKVMFEERNLFDENFDFWRPDAFDVIFCRNVLMYFTPDATRTVIDRFARALSPRGFLFLGPAETLRGISHDYHLRHAHDAFFYQKRDIEDMHQSQMRIAPPFIATMDDSWVTAIGRASERIAWLSRDSRLSLRREGEASSSPSTSDLVAVREMIREERYNDALSVLSELTEEERRDPDAQLLRAVSLTNSGNVQEAEQLCHEVLAGDELNAEAHYLLALCLEHAGKNEAAMGEDRIAIYLDPRFAMPHLHMGLLNKRLGSREDARRSFRQAFTLLPREDASRVLLFGGGFSRETLLRLCEAELRASRG